MGGDKTMTLFFSHSTPLIFHAWTPTSKSEYAWACIFLICLSAGVRALHAVRSILESHRKYHQRNGNAARLLVPDDEELDAPGPKHYVPCKNRLQNLYALTRRHWAGWNFKLSLARASFELLLAVVGYALMLAVMTMNGGYILSVLGGLFIGAFVNPARADDEHLH